MTIERANEITDGIASVLVSPRHVGRIFTPISRTGATTRTELAHAIYIVVAEVFQSIRRQGKADNAGSEFANFVRDAGGSLHFVLMLHPCLPDSELRLIATLSDDSIEFSHEESRLQQLARNDGAMELETVDSFVSFLRTLDAFNRDYWPQVYQRIGLLCPSNLVPLPSRPRAASEQRVSSTPKPWWRFW